MSSAFGWTALSAVFVLAQGCASNTHDSTTPSNEARPAPSAGSSQNPGDATSQTPAASSTDTTQTVPPERPPTPPPEPPFPEVEANPSIPRVTVQELEASGLCGKQNPIQVTGFVTELWTCKCVTVDARTVCDNMCIEVASLRESPDTPKDSGVGLRLPQPSRDLFAEDGHYVIQGQCLMTNEPNPKIQVIYVDARSRLP